jgi:hypothetical protein
LIKPDVSELNLTNTRFAAGNFRKHQSRALYSLQQTQYKRYFMGGNLVLVPTTNYLMCALPKPTMHLFYNRRIEDMDDDTKVQWLVQKPGNDR